MSTTTATPDSPARPGLTALAARFQALSDEKRLRILDILRDGEHCVCDLTEALDVGQSLLSFHLRALKDAGLVEDRREGRWSYYALVPGALTEVEDAVADLRNAAAATSRSGVGEVARCCS